MLRDRLEQELKDLLADRLEGWELVEFLQLPSQHVIDAFEDEILENLNDVLELAGVRYETNEENNGPRSE